MPSEDDSPPPLGSSHGQLAAGQRIADRYRLEEWLGQGGMGTVWRATDETLDLPVALKFLNDVLARDDAALDDLKRETRRALQLTHPNIVRVHSLVEDAERGLACIAMEFVPGENLMQRRWRRRLPFFEPPDIATWTTQLCDSLAYAHVKARIIHRDLKPGNLLLDVEDDLKITDFGIAASANESITRLTGSSASGTMSYMSPQQAAGDRPSPTDDLYALGSTLYELLTGEPPFGRDAPYAQIRDEPPPPIAEARRRLHGVEAPVPPEWEKTVAALLAKRPEDRPPTARDVAARLGLAASVPGLRHAPADDDEANAATQVGIPTEEIPRTKPAPEAAYECPPTLPPTERIPRAAITPAPAPPSAEAAPARMSQRTSILIGAGIGLLLGLICIAVVFWRYWANR